jgi:transposase
MRPPIFVRELTEEERSRLVVGLRSKETFVVRRCQILLASARGEWVPRVAATLGCNDQTVRNALKRFEQDGLDACLSRRSSRAHTIHAKLDAVGCERVRALLHQSPRTFGKPTSVWTLELAAEVSFSEGITAELVSDETIRQAMRRLGVRWTRAKQWITSPDPEYARKKCSRPLDPSGREPSYLGTGLPGRGLVESSGSTKPAHLGRGGPLSPASRTGGREGRPGPQGAGLLWLAAAR